MIKNILTALYLRILTMFGLTTINNAAKAVIKERNKSAIKYWEDIVKDVERIETIEIGGYIFIKSPIFKSKDKVLN